MAIIKIDPAVGEIFPSIKVVYLVSEGLQPVSDSGLSEIQNILMSACTQGQERWSALQPSEIPVIMTWRERFKRFPRPKDASCSIENLIRRIRSGKFPPSICPTVDLVNAVSISHGLPLGGENLDRLQPFADCTLKLAVAQGTEEYEPLGQEGITQNPLAGEILYADAAGVICRAMNWRESHRACLTNGTQRAVFATEVFSTEEEALALAALTDLQRLIDTYCCPRQQEISITNS